MALPSTVHPFPARMAPELALNALKTLPHGSHIVDPMCGSGTVLRYASDLGFRATGADVDPLAVLMARVWNRKVNSDRVYTRAEQVVGKALTLKHDQLHLPWIDGDKRTADFVDFWFAQRQTEDLRRLASVLVDQRGPISDVLKLALSRIIVTKDAGASLARDTSHSRPHKVSETNSFDVFSGFRRALTRILRALDSHPPLGNVRVLREDGRALPGVARKSADCVLTSPPYLNAIDYLRGHRLALVWLGHSVGSLSTIRSGSVGAERRLTGVTDPLVDLARELAWREPLSSRHQGILDRYVHDMGRSARQVRRILKPGCRAVLVVGNSTLKGTFVHTSEIVRMAYEHHGMVLLEQSEREIPSNRRYLPPPTGAGGRLAQRMRVEVIMTFDAPTTATPTVA